jgi:hypothetical protein
MALAWFETAIPPKGEALGVLTRTSWGDFVERLSRRREGAKDGPCFAPATFELKPDGVHVGRRKNGALSRTAIALDIETCRNTGEIPPAPEEALRRAGSIGLAALIYSSHSHDLAADPRYRVVFPISDEIACEIPAPEIMAEHLGLAGVLDKSKINAASLFYAPSCPVGLKSVHFFAAVDGMPVSADRITDTGIVLLRKRQAEANRIAAEAQMAAAERRSAKLAAGFDPDDSLIEKIRVHLDLEQILLNHGYAQSGRKFRHPNSSSGQYGADIKTLGGVDRVFSHNATDPLHEGNLPEWCGKVTALDAFDVAAILDYGGDRKKALTSLSEKFGLSKTAERKVLAGLIFRLIRRRASQEEIETQARAEGERLGLTWDEVCRVAVWAKQKTIQSRRAA